MGGNQYAYGHNPKVMIGMLLVCIEQHRVSVGSALWLNMQRII